MKPGHRAGREVGGFHWGLRNVCGFSESVFVLLTFIIGNVPQRRVAGVTLALALTEASFNPAL